MELQSGSVNKPTKNTTHVLSSAKKEQRNFTWKIDNFRQCIGIPIYKTNIIIAEFPFTIVFKIFRISRAVLETRNYQRFF